MDLIFAVGQGGCIIGLLFGAYIALTYRAGQVVDPTTLVARHQVSPEPGLHEALECE